MAAGFEFFTSADAGAPTMNGTAGRWAALLDWVLVGKGGWAKPFTPASNVHVYRSATGNRFYLRIDDSQTRYTRAKGYRAMTALSTGTFPFPNTTQAPLTSWGMVKRYVADSNNCRYWGVRTNQYLVVVFENLLESVEGYSQRAMFIFGDVPSLCESDAHNTIIVGTPDASTSSSDFIGQCYGVFGPGSVFPGTTVQSGISGSPDGSVASPVCGVCLPFSQGASSTQEAICAKSGRLHFADLIFGSGNTINGTSDAAYPRARIPNLHMVFGPVRSVSNANLPTIDLETFTLGSRSFLTLMRYSNTIDTYSTDAFLLETTDTDGAL